MRASSGKGPKPPNNKAFDKSFIYSKLPEVSDVVIEAAMAIHRLGRSRNFLLVTDSVDIKKSLKSLFKASFERGFCP